MPVSYTPPLATWLIAAHSDILRDMARSALEEDNEIAATLSYTSGDESMVLSGPSEGTGRTVTSPPAEDDATSAVYLHTHPRETQVTFSTTDIMAFVRSSLATVPFGRLPDGPHGYGVIGRRGGDVSAREAQLQTIEPTQKWADASVMERDRIRRDLQNRAANALTRNEDNPLFDILGDYVRRSSVEFSTRVGVGETRTGP